uniref:Uncharacterized protein n=1 Tax=Triticum urartu TaxID=4572 RepID=A0A8R7Q730_TRIUA
PDSTPRQPRTSQILFSPGLARTCISSSSSSTTTSPATSVPSTAPERHSSVHAAVLISSQGGRWCGCLTMLPEDHYMPGGSEAIRISTHPFWMFLFAEFFASMQGCQQRKNMPCRCEINLEAN